MRSDLDLLSQFRDIRSPGAFEAIVVRHGPMVFRVGLRLLRNHHEAEEVVQTTFLQLVKHPEAASPHLIGWLHRSATNAARNLLRARARRALHELARGPAMDETRRDGADELREEIDAALDRLPVDQREALILHYLEGRDFEESARLAGCSAAAARKRSQRGLQQLRTHLSERGIVCGLGALTAYLCGESAANAAVPTTVLANLTQACTSAPQTQAAATVSHTALKAACWTTHFKLIAAAAVLATGSLGSLALIRHLAPAAPAPALASAAPRGAFRALLLEGAATVASSRPIFASSNKGNDVLMLPSWGEVTAQGIPFRVSDPHDGAVKNVIVLRSPLGETSRRLPVSASVRCGLPARAIHLLSGVSGWGYPLTKGRTVAMIVRLRYAGGTVEDHPLQNGVHFADYYGRDEVPGSTLALRLEHGHQMRYLAITPGRQEPIDRIEFLKGNDRTGPIVMAVTIEVPERTRSAPSLTTR